MPYVKNYRYLLSWFYEDGSAKGIGTGYFTVHKKIREEDIPRITEKIKEEYQHGFVDLIAFSLCEQEAGHDETGPSFESA